MSRRKNRADAAGRAAGGTRAWPDLRPALLVGFLTFLVYAPTLWSDFVYDARAQILVGDYIHNPANLPEVLTFRVLGRDVLDFNRPVQLLSLMVDSLLWGRNPVGYHLTSNLLHAGNAAMVCLLLLRLCPAGEFRNREVVAAGAALVFALHPVNVEAVTEVSCREDLLVSFFLLLGLLAATGFATRRGGAAMVWGAGCVGTFLLAAASKETGIVAPFVLAAYWLIFQRNQPSLRWVVLIGAALVVVGGFFVARFTLQPTDSRIFLHQPTHIGGSLAGVLTIQPRLWVFLLGNVVWPGGLSADYVPQNVAGIVLWPALGVLIIVVGFQIGLGWKSRVAALGGLIFWLGLAPVSNFLPMFRPLADRFLYLPMIGVAFTVAGILFFGTRRREFAVPVFAALTLTLIPLALLTVKRQAVFANSLNLWADTLKKSPFSDTAANNLGYAQLEAGNNPEALTHFQRAWEMTRGQKADAMAGAAIALERLGRPIAAEQALREAIQRDPRYGQPRRLVEALTTSEEHADVLETIGDRLTP